MNKVNDPWSKIEPPKDKNELNVRRADPSHPLDFWLGRDIQGNYVFYLDANVEASTIKSTPRLSGVTLGLFDTGKSGCRLVLTLNDKELHDIFGTLCADLMRGTAQLKRMDPAGLKIVISRLLRWQELLERARDNLLSQSRIIGLIGELLLLRDFMLPALPAYDAVQSWRGPFGDEQDFLLTGGIIEVKTQLSTSDEYLSISSESQLDISSGPIMICHQTVYVPSSEEAGAVSLNGLVADLGDRISDTDMSAIQLFETRLIEAGYIRRKEYDRPRWLLNARTFLEVREDFPRLCPPDLAAGIDRVRYRIAVHACKNFELDENTAKEWAFDAGN